MQKTRLLATSALLFAIADPAGAEPPTAVAGPAADRVVYDAAYYAVFAPRTALDMIRQTPGFTLQEGLDRRGFAGALGNVLIDGKRPIAKSQSLSDILQRLPASQVVRIELIRGGTNAGDTGSHALIANVVRTASAGDGVWSLGTEYAGRAPMPNFFASWSGRLGSTDYSLGGNGYSLMRHLPGRRVISDGEGELVGTRSDRSPRTFYEIAVNGEAERPMIGGSVRLTGQAFASRYHEDSAIRSFGPDGQLHGSEFNPYTEWKRNLEAGLDRQRRLGSWDLSLAALATRTRFESDAGSRGSDAEGNSLFAFTQDLVRHSGETILRAKLSGSPAAGHQVEAALEGALNTLRQNLLRTLDLGNGPFPLPVPNSNLSVRERRAEFHAADRWQLDRRWSTELRVAAEASRLSFTGDTNDSVTLFYLKPSLQVARGFGARNELRLRVYRDVGQLDFTDFVSSASFVDDIIHGGNPELRPEKSWRLELGADVRFGASGALSVTLFRHWIDNVVDLVPVEQSGVRFDAPGNIGPGRVNGIEGTVRLPLAPLVPGGSLSLEGSLRDARVTDPLTGRKRTISDFAESSLKVEFRQDRPRDRLAWGVTWTGKPERRFFRFNEVETKRESLSLDVWAERALGGDYKVRLTWLSILGNPEKRERIFFEPDRTSEVSEIERWRRNPGSWILLSVSGGF